MMVEIEGGFRMSDGVIFVLHETDTHQPVITLRTDGVIEIDPAALAELAGLVCGDATLPDAVKVCPTCKYAWQPHTDRNLYCTLEESKAGKPANTLGSRMVSYRWWCDEWEMNDVRD